VWRCNISKIFADAIDRNGCENTQAWLSTAGQCMGAARPGDGSGCTWREVGVSKVVPSAAVDDAIVALVQEYANTYSGPSRFAGCGDDRGSLCWSSAFFDTITGNNSRVPPLAPAVISAAWIKAFDAADGVRDSETTQKSTHPRLKLDEDARQTATVSNGTRARSFGNRLRTPPMGFNTWNSFGCSVDASVLKQTAALLVSTGLAKAGFVHVNSDDCWMLTCRDPKLATEPPRSQCNGFSGPQRPDSVRFPEGIAATIKHIRSLGLQVGLYTSASNFTCDGRAGSCLLEQVDVAQWAAWGVTYMKADSCGSCRKSKLLDYRAFQQAIDITGSGMFLSIEGTPPFPEVANGLFGQSRRVGHDISATWTSMLSLVDIGSGLWSFVHNGSSTSAGWWNDFDILEIGNGPFAAELSPTSLAMARTHMTYWCILKSVLLLGNKLSMMSAATLSIVSNADAIRVNQDILGRAGRRVASLPPQNYTDLDHALPDDIIAVLSRCNSSSPTQHWRFEPANATTTAYGRLWTNDASGRVWLLSSTGSFSHGTILLNSSTNWAATGTPRGLFSMWPSADPKPAGIDKLYTFSNPPVSSAKVYGNHLGYFGAFGASGPLPHSQWLQSGCPAYLNCPWQFNPAAPMAVRSTISPVSSPVIDDDHVGNATNKVNGSEFCLDVSRVGNIELWYAPMSGGKHAVAIINRSPANQQIIRVKYENLGLSADFCFQIRDVWKGTDVAGLACSSFMTPPIDSRDNFFAILSRPSKSLKHDDVERAPSHPDEEAGTRYMGFYAHFYDDWTKGGSRLSDLASVNASSWMNMLISRNATFLRDARATNPLFTALLAVMKLLFEHDAATCAAHPHPNCNFMRAVAPSMARQHAQSFKKLIRANTIQGLFLGDEVNAPYADINSTVALLRAELGDADEQGAPLLYINQAYVFDGPDVSNPCTIDRNASQSGPVAEHSRTAFPIVSGGSWPAVPAGLNFVGFDAYCSPPKCNGSADREVHIVRDYATRCLYPLLAEHQRFMAVPGIFADEAKPVEHQDVHVEQKLQAYESWLRDDNDVKLAGLNPWHLDRRQMSRYGLGARDLPRSLAAVIRIGQQLTHKSDDVATRATCGNAHKILREKTNDSSADDSVFAKYSSQRSAGRNSVRWITNRYLGPANAPFVAENPRIWEGTFPCCTGWTVFANGTLRQGDIDAQVAGYTQGEIAADRPVMPIIGFSYNMTLGDLSMTALVKEPVKLAAFSADCVASARCHNLTGLVIDYEPGNSGAPRSTTAAEYAHVLEVVAHTMKRSGFQLGACLCGWGILGGYSAYAALAPSVAMPSWPTMDYWPGGGSPGTADKIDRMISAGLRPTTISLGLATSNPSLPRNSGQQPWNETHLSEYLAHALKKGVSTVDVWWCLQMAPNGSVATAGVPGFFLRAMEALAANNQRPRALRAVAASKSLKTDDTSERRSLPVPDVVRRGNKLVDLRSGLPVQLKGVGTMFAESSCIRGTGVIQGPFEQSIPAWHAWGINAVRLPLNEDCWLGQHGALAQYSGKFYRTTVIDFVEQLLENGIVTILDLHWSNSSGGLATGQDLFLSGTSPKFWESVASTSALRSRPGVIFELFNEPHGFLYPPPASFGLPSACFDGRVNCTYKGIAGQTFAGYNSTTLAVRVAANASNLILFAGRRYAMDLAYILEHLPHDPLGNFAVAWHPYEFKCTFEDGVCTGEDGTVNATAVTDVLPLLITELAPLSSAAGAYMTGFQRWADSLPVGTVSLFPFCWNPGPYKYHLLANDSNWAGSSPTAWGQSYKEWQPRKKADQRASRVVGASIKTDDDEDLLAPPPPTPCVPPACIPSEKTAQCGRHGIPWGPSAPQFHFHDSSCGNNDPNAPLYDPNHQLYHLFYQDHEPGGTAWGHAVSADQVFWAHLPVALWNDKWWDYTAVFSGSATIVDGRVKILYPGLCVTHNETTCPNTDPKSSGITINLATPKNASDPWMTLWAKNPVPTLNGTSSDPSTAWRTKSGEWRFTLEDTSVHVSHDFVHWKPGTGGSGFWGCDCPDFFELAPIVASSSPTGELPPGGPTHAHKCGACIPSEGVGDYYRLGTYDEGADGTTGVFTNMSAMTPTDAFRIGDGTPGSTGPSGGPWNCSADPSNPTVLPVNYAAKSFWDAPNRRRVDWTWVNTNNHDPIALDGTAGSMGLPTVMTYEPTLRRLLYNPLPELKQLRTARIGGFSSSHQLPPNPHLTSFCSGSVAATAAWIGAPHEAVLEQAEYNAVFPLPAVGAAGAKNVSAAEKIQKKKFSKMQKNEGCTEIGMVFSVGAGQQGLQTHTGHRNISVFFSRCPGGPWTAGVDMRHPGAPPCNKLRMAGRYTCRTTQSFELLPHDTTLSFQAFVDHTNLQVWFMGGRVQLTSPWPLDRWSDAAHDNAIADVGAYSVGTATGGIVDNIDIWGMCSMWISPAEVLRRRDATHVQAKTDDDAPFSLTEVFTTTKGVGGNETAFRCRDIRWQKIGFAPTGAIERAPMKTEDNLVAYLSRDACTPCSQTPCGQCISGCPDLSTTRSGCVLPDGTKSTRNQCLCNAHNISCHDGWSSNHTLCPLVPPPPPFEANKAWQIYLTLGDSSWAPSPYNMTQFDIKAGPCADDTVSCSGDTWTNGYVSGRGWPAMLQEDRGPDGKPCAGTGSPQRGPCYTAAWSPSCKGAKVDTGTEYGALCCRPGGCSPQEGNLTTILEDTAAAYISGIGPNFSGNCAIDYEGWNNVVTDATFGSCAVSPPRWSSSFMRNYSIALVKKRQPGITAIAAAKQAAKEYSTAATAIMVGVLEMAKRVRPKCNWGFYEVPCSFGSPCAGTRAEGNSGAGEPLCGYDAAGDMGTAMRSQAAQQQPIVDASDTLYPSMYPKSIAPQTTAAQYQCLSVPHMQGLPCLNVTLNEWRAAIRSTVGQAVRSATASPAKPKVLPYFWQYCDQANFPCYSSNASFHLGREGIAAALRLPYELGADGQVLWVDSEETKRTGELKTLLETVTGPLGEELISAATDCSAQWCSGKGRCHPLPAPAGPPTIQPTCTCFEGHGPSCNATLPSQKSDDTTKASQMVHVSDDACSTPADCHLNGDCVAGRCRCDPRWRGSPSCSVMAQFVVSVAHDASEAETQAAAELAQLGGKLFAPSGGGALRVITPAAATNKRQLAVGSGAAIMMGLQMSQLTMNQLGEEGFVATSNRTQILRKTGSVALCGGTNATRGTRYSVYHLMELFGVRFLAWDETVFPTTVLPLPAFDIEFVPQMEYRNLDSWPAMSHPTQAHYFHINGGPQADSSRARASDTVGAVQPPLLSPYATPPGFVHTSYEFFGTGKSQCKGGHFPCGPPTAVYDANPSWFWPHNDSAAYGQLCWSAPGLVEQLTAQAILFLKARPDSTILSISQNDNIDYCKDPDELKIITEEGSPMGPMLRAVNKIARALAPLFPHVKMDTLAYEYSQPPPKLVRPESNVIIRLCDIRSNMGFPLTHPSNSAFATVLKSWSRLVSTETGSDSGGLYVWNYVSDMGNLLQP
jgi:alpha-galactosidase